MVAGISLDSCGLMVDRVVVGGASLRRVSEPTKGIVQAVKSEPVALVRDLKASHRVD